MLCTGLDWNLSGPQNPCPTKNETLVAAFKAVTTIEADEAVACLIIWEVEKKRKKGTHTHTHTERELYQQSNSHLKLLNVYQSKKSVLCEKANDCGEVKSAIGNYLYNSS